MISGAAARPRSRLGTPEEFLFLVIKCVRPLPAASGWRELLEENYNVTLNIGAPPSQAEIEQI